MSRMIEAPDDVYNSLERVARERGSTPVDWIANSVPSLAAERPFTDLLEGLTRTVDRAEVPEGERRHAAFSELLTRKFQKQGLRWSVITLADAGPLIALVDKGQGEIHWKRVTAANV